MTAIFLKETRMVISDGMEHFNHLITEITN